MVVFLNKVDQLDDPELLRTRRTPKSVKSFQKRDFDGDNILIMLGSALAALESRDDNIPARADPEELMEAVDNWIPQPERPLDKPFDRSKTCSSISGRGTVVTGRVETGIVKVVEEVEIVGIKDAKKTTVTGVEIFRKLLDQGPGWRQHRCADPRRRP